MTGTAARPFPGRWRPLTAPDGRCPLLPGHCRRLTGADGPWRPLPVADGRWPLLPGHWRGLTGVGLCCPGADEGWRALAVAARALTGADGCWPLLPGRWRGLTGADGRWPLLPGRWRGLTGADGRWALEAVASLTLVWSTLQIVDSHVPLNLMVISIASDLVVDVVSITIQRGSSSSRFFFFFFFFFFFCLMIIVFFLFRFCNLLSWLRILTRCGCSSFLLRIVSGWRVQKMWSILWQLSRRRMMGLVPMFGARR